MAIACAKCGYGFNNDPAKPCKMCGKPLTQTAQIGTGVSRVPVGENPDDDAPEFGGPVTTGQNILPPRKERTGKSPRGATPGERGILQGRISHLERTDEAPPRTVCWAMSQLLLWPLIIVPYVALFMSSGILAIVFAILGFSMLSQLFNPFIWTTTLMEIFEIFVLRRMRLTPTIPVYRGLISSGDGAEYHFVLMGPLRLGNLIQGRSVRLHGRLRRGTFIVTRGVEIGFSGGEIRSSYRDPWRIVFPVLVAIYGLLAFYSLGHWNDLVGSPVIQSILK